VYPAHLFRKQVFVITFLAFASFYHWQRSRSKACRANAGQVSRERWSRVRPSVPWARRPPETHFAAEASVKGTKTKFESMWKRLQESFFCEVSRGFKATEGISCWRFPELGDRRNASCQNGLWVKWRPLRISWIQIRAFWPSFERRGLHAEKLRQRRLSKFSRCDLRLIWFDNGIVVFPKVIPRTHSTDFRNAEMSDRNGTSTAITVTGELQACAVLTGETRLLLHHWLWISNGVAWASLTTWANYGRCSG
jgi:hypothetical protein